MSKHNITNTHGDINTQLCKLANDCWFEINLLYRNVKISMGNLNLKNIRQSCTISMLDVRNNFIRNRFTVNSRERKSALFFFNCYCHPNSQGGVTWKSIQFSRDITNAHFAGNSQYSKFCRFSWTSKS